MIYKVNLQNKSIENAGIPKDYKESISEFIWNGFDAKASQISIVFRDQGMDHIDGFEIIDNGTGVNLEDLEKSFGAFLVSPKAELSRSSYIQGRRGKGRFSFIRLGETAVWETNWYKPSENTSYSYSIVINSSNAEDYSVTDEVTQTLGKIETGTTVRFTNTKLNAGHLTSDDFLDFLASEFGWFLYLNKKNGFKILVNGQELDYDRVISQKSSVTWPITATDKMLIKENFEIFFIRWKRNIGGRYYYNYYLNTEHLEVYKETTKYNNNTIGFAHSVYIVSPYFDSFQPTSINEKDMRDFFASNQSDETFKRLRKYLDKYTFDKQKEYIKVHSKKIVENLKKEKVMPSFEDSDMGKIKEADFNEVLTEIVVVVPQLFINTGADHKKTILGFIQLLLDSDERINIIKIIEKIVNLTPQERKDLAETLTKTSFSNITNLIKMMASRQSIIALLNNLVFDLTKFTNERDHIQIAIEENYWLFGEQYNLISADENFEKLLVKYIHYLDGSPDKKIVSSIEDKLRRPDIFISRKLAIGDSADENQVEENVIVELKRPSVVIGREQLRQVQDYLDIVISEPRLNSSTQRFKFILIGKDIDETIKREYIALKSANRRGLVYSIEKYEIYVYTWADITFMYDIRHKFITSKLNINQETIEKEIQDYKSKIDKTTPAKIVARIKQLSTIAK